MDKSKIIEWLNINKIDLINEEVFFNYVDILSFERMKLDYIYFFVNSRTNTFMTNISTNDIVELIEYDKKISMDFLKSILMFESKFKNIMIDELIKFYNLSNDELIVFKYSDQQFLRLFPNIANHKDVKIDEFKSSLFDYVINSEKLINYNSLLDIPLNDLAQSWPFAVANTFFKLLDNTIKENILVRFGISSNNALIFHKVLNAIIKVRNIISHYGVFYNIKLTQNKVEFFKVFSSIKGMTNGSNVKFISIDKLCGFIDYAIRINLCKKSIDSNIRDCKLINEAKTKLLQLVYGIIS